MNDPVPAIKYFKRLPQGTDTFSVDLSGTDLAPGDDILIITLWDKNFNGGFPNPDTGDMIGFYVDQEKLGMNYSLSAGVNAGIHINVNRDVFDFEASVSGMVRGEEEGDLTLIAYTGEFNSSDFTDIDIDDVSGYARYTKNTSDDLPYTVDVLPYGKNIPIKNTFIFA